MSKINHYQLIKVNKGNIQIGIFILVGEILIFI